MTLSTAVQNEALPYFSNSFTNTAAVAFWGNHNVHPSAPVGIYFKVNETAPNRQTTFEFFLGEEGDSNHVYYFLVVFYENRPNVSMPRDESFLWALGCA